MTQQVKTTVYVVIIVVFLFGGNLVAKKMFNMELGKRYLECPWCDKIIKYQDSRLQWDSNQHPPGYCKPPVPSVKRYPGYIE